MRVGPRLGLAEQDDASAGLRGIDVRAGCRHIRLRPRYPRRRLRRALLRPNCPSRRPVPWPGPRRQPPPPYPSFLYDARLRSRAGANWGFSGGFCSWSFMTSSMARSSCGSAPRATSWGRLPIHGRPLGPRRLGAPGRDPPRRAGRPWQVGTGQGLRLQGWSAVANLPWSRR